MTSQGSIQHAAKRSSRGAPEAPQPTVGPVARWAPVVVVGAAVLLFAILKLYSFNVVIGDEHVYFNMALLVNKGLLPYRDFFYTHPPLHLYEAVLAFRLFGYSLTLGKLLPNLAMVVSGVLIFAVGRRALGPAEGALGCAIFLLSFDPLRISSHFTGVDLTFALAMAGWWLAYGDRPVAAGICYGLGTLVAVYILPGAAAVALMLWWRSRGRMIRFVTATAAITVAGNLLFYGLAGWSYIYQVYVTQSLKGPEGSLIGYSLTDRLGFILFENRLLTAGVIAGIVLLGADARTRLKERYGDWELRDVVSGRVRLWEEPRAEGLLACVTWLVIFWVFYTQLRLLHAYYFIFVMPVFGWLSAYAYLEIARGIVRLFRPLDAEVTRADRRAERRRTAPPRRTDRFSPLIPAAVALVLTLASIGLVDVLYVPFMLQRYGTGVSRYPWRPNPFVRAVDPWVRTLFWSPQYDPQHPISGIARYLQHESEQITVADQLYAAVRQYTEPTDTIFGEVGVVQFVASETGRRIAGNLVDTSTYQISYKLVRVEDWIAAIEKDHVRLLVVRRGSTPMSYPQFRDYASRNFQTVAVVRDPAFGPFEIMRRIGS